MTVWTPAASIRVKVLGLAWRGDRLLLGEVEDSSGRVKGVRALGGAIEFGETREAALAREFREELNCAIELAGPWHAFENLYEHEGATGHEFIFAANVRLGRADVYAAETVRFVEGELADCRAGWFAPLDLPAGIDLYPAGLVTAIRSGECGPP